MPVETLNMASSPPAMSRPPLSRALPALAEAQRVALLGNGLKWLVLPAGRQLGLAPLPDQTELAAASATLSLNPSMGRSQAATSTTTFV